MQDLGQQDHGMQELPILHVKRKQNIYRAKMRKVSTLSIYFHSFVNDTNVLHKTYGSFYVKLVATTQKSNS